jgi:hypothetical protein
MSGQLDRVCPLLPSILSGSFRKLSKLRLRRVAGESAKNDGGGGCLGGEGGLGEAGGVTVLGARRRGGGWEMDLKIKKKFRSIGILGQRAGGIGSLP